MNVKVETRGTLVAHEAQLAGDQPELSAEASDLGITPGKWPETIVVRLHEDDAGWDLGFTFQYAESKGGAIQALKYATTGFRYWLTITTDR